MTSINQLFGTAVPLSADDDLLRRLQCGPPMNTRCPVRGPRGEIITPADLPIPNTHRWVVSRKATVVAAVWGGLLTEAEACERYSLTMKEFRSWEARIRKGGLPALRVTREYETHETVPATTPSTTVSLGQVPLGDMIFDSEKPRLIGADGVGFHLKPTFRKLLTLFAGRVGEVVTRGDIMSALRCKPGVQWKVVDVHVCQLRRLLESVSTRVRIETAWGRGYKLVTTPA